MDFNEDYLPWKLSEVTEKVNADSIWDDDILKNKFVADVLTRFVVAPTPAVTIALNGKWGSGKTFLLKRWHQDLVKSGARAIYFNAWEDDHLEDPLIAIIGQLVNEFSDKSFKTVLGRIKKKAGAILKSLITEGVHTQIGVNIETIEGKVNPVRTIFDTYVEQNREKQLLKESLCELLKVNYEESALPLVFIVDELDRCRPTFAIEVLERIKHLFNIEDVIFVFGVDLTQLGISIQSVYGQIDVANYLHRFFDYEITLPLTKQKYFFEHLQRRFQHHIAKYDIPFDDVKIAPLEDIARIHKLSLREIEYGMRLVTLATKLSNSKNSSIETFFNLALWMLKRRDVDIYRKALEYNLPIETVIEYVYPSTEETTLNAWIFSHVLYCYYAAAGTITVESTKVYEELTAYEEQIDSHLQYDITNFSFPHHMTRWIKLLKSETIRELFTTRDFFKQAKTRNVLPTLLDVLQW